MRNAFEKLFIVLYMSRGILLGAILGTGITIGFFEEPMFSGVLLGIMLYMSGCLGIYVGMTETLDLVNEAFKNNTGGNYENGNQ